MSVCVCPNSSPNRKAGSDSDDSLSAASSSSPPSPSNGEKQQAPKSDTLMVLLELAHCVGRLLLLIVYCAACFVELPAGDLIPRLPMGTTRVDKFRTQMVSENMDDDNRARSDNGAADAHLYMAVCMFLINRA